MRIYIASSWKNQHAVEMLTDILRAEGNEIISFVAKAVSDEGRTNIRFDFEQWIASPDGHDKFLYDTHAATNSDLIVYIGPAGTDAWAEVGAAFGAGIPVFGLWAKGEPAGLMRKMVRWFRDYRELVSEIQGGINDRNRKTTRGNRYKSP